MTPAGLCDSCVHAHPISASTGATYLRCNLSFSDPRFPRYPTLPVVQCAGYTPVAPPQRSDR